MAENTTAQEVQETKVQQEQATEETFTRKQMDAEADRRVNQALEKAKAKWEAEWSNKIQLERSEAERLAKMSEEEKQAETQRKLKEEFDNERKQFEEERKQFENERMKLQLTKELSAKDIPIQFADFLIADSAEATKANMDVFVQTWNTLLQTKIEEHVSKALQGNPPKQANNSGQQPMTKSEFVRLPYAEREKMLKEQPDLVQEILNS